MSSFTSAPPLPVELYRAIFSFARACGQVTAAQLPLLCRALRYEAEDVLYHTPLLKTKKCAMAFGKTISACPRRANAVRGLAFNAWPGWENGAIHNRDRELDRMLRKKLRLNVTDDEDEEEYVPGWSAELRSSLAHLHRLDTIIIQQRGAVDLVCHLLQGLDIPLRRIQGEPLSSYSPSVESTLRQFPELEEVHMFGEPGYSSQLPAKLQLPKLRIFSTCRASMLAHVEPASCPKLTHLSVKWVTSEDIYKIVHVVGPQLVSLRLDQIVWDEQGRLYPTNGPAWRQCARLKYLRVRHYQWRHDMSRYLHDDAVDATNLPPALQTLVWSPAWTRVFTYHMYPDEEKRADVRRFAEAIMRASRTLTAVVYEWTGDRVYKCYLTPTACKETEEFEVDDDAWTRV